jgi:hypothetical protein
MQRSRDSLPPFKVRVLGRRPDCAWALLDRVTDDQVCGGVSRSPRSAIRDAYKMGHRLEAAGWFSDPSECDEPVDREPILTPWD